MTDPEDIEWTEVEMGWCRISSHYKCRGWFQDTDRHGRHLARRHPGFLEPEKNP